MLIRVARHTFPTLILLSIIPAVQAAENADSQEGWINLLEENDLSRHWTTRGNWSINDDGVVTLEPRAGEKGWARFDAYLWSEKQYDDFEIEFD